MLTSHIKRILSEIHRKKPHLFILDKKYLDCWEEITKEQRPQAIGTVFSEWIQQGKVCEVRVAKPSDATTFKIREDGTNCQNKKVYVYEKCKMM